MSQPLVELPALWQSVNIDVESVAPIRQFIPTESYDVANMSAIIQVEVSAENEYRLLLSCDVESGTRATVRVMSTTDDVFDKIKRFNKIGKAEAKDFIPLLDKSGFVPVEAPEVEKTAYIRKNFKSATIKIPAGQQKLRIHASQKLNPIDGDPKKYRLTVFAPLLGFTLAGGQSNLSVAVTFPPQFQGATLNIAEPVVEPLPGQPQPGLVSEFKGDIACLKAFAWCWRNDPKVTINYTYS